MSLRTKIVCSYTIAMLVMMIAFATIIQRTSTNTAIDKANSSSSRELVLILNNIETLVDSFEDYSRLIASDIQLQAEIRISMNEDPSDTSNGIKQLANQSRYSRIIRNIIAPNTKAEAILVYTTEELVYSGYDLDMDRVNEVIHMTYIEEALDYQKPLWKGPNDYTFNNGNKETMFSVAKSIMDKETGEKIGVVILLFDEDSISDIYDGIKQNTRDEFYVINDQRQVISAIDKDVIGEDLTGVIGLNEADLNKIGANGSFITSHDKVEVLYAIREFRHLNWSIISQITLYELIEERHQLVKIMVVIVTLSSIIFVLIAIFIASTITNPILRLTKLMSDIIDRDIRLRARTDEKGEVAVLAKGFNTMMDKIEQLIQQVYTEQALKRKGELALNQEQIKPHFLYNAIGTIESLININRYDDAKAMAKELASFYRLSLSNGEDIISIEEEIDLTKNYLKIQGYRYVEFFDFTIEVDPIIYNEKIPKMTLQPIVENAIYHGIKEKGSVGRISIRSEIEDDQLSIFVYDDGCGMTQARIEQCLTQDLEKKRFGIYSVNQRLKLYYGEVYGLSIKSEVGNYTEVRVSIPREG